jgi:hypothetical protein
VVTPAAAASFGLSGFPFVVTAGVPGNETVTAKDAFGNTATGYTGTVHLTSSDSQAVLVPTDHAYTAADAGTFTFGVTLNTVGIQSITATDTADSTIAGSQDGITVIDGGSVPDPNLDVRTVASGPGNPTTMTFLGDNDFLVLDKRSGRVNHVINGVVSATKFDMGAGPAIDAVPPPSLEQVDQFFGSLKRKGELFASSPARHWSGTDDNLASDLVWGELPLGVRG